MSDTSIRDSANSVWGSGWQEVCNQWSLGDSVLHFNHGAYGAVPAAVRRHQIELLEHIDRNSTGFFRREIESLLEEARLEAAKFCGADPEGFAWVRNASEGITIALTAIPLKPGQEILITNHIYPAVRLAVENKCSATGAKLVEVQVPITEDDTQIVAAITAGMTDKTGVLLVDEIASATARVFPIRELTKITNAREIVSLVDGAHAPGMYALSLDTLGADLWVGNFHKWICAPHGAGALWVAPKWRNLVRPSSVSFRDRFAYPQLFSRLGTDDLTPILCVPFAMRFLQQIGLDRIYDYNKKLAAYGAEVVTKALGTSEIKGRFAARHPIALPAGVAVEPDSALELQTRIATELHAEVSVSTPMAGEKQAAVVISAYAYNHPGEYERFGKLLRNFLGN